MPTRGRRKPEITLADGMRLSFQLACVSLSLELLSRQDFHEFLNRVLLLLPPARPISLHTPGNFLPLFGTHEFAATIVPGMSIGVWELNKE